MSYICEPFTLYLGSSWCAQSAYSSRCSGCEFLLPGWTHTGYPAHGSGIRSEEDLSCKYSHGVTSVLNSSCKPLKTLRIVNYF